ncbi:MAG: FAD-dependent oxidoreductase [Nanoarchaeota archaeon]
MAKPNNETDIAIIGGGVIGTALAHTLSASYAVLLFEKNYSLGDEQSGRSSGVNHAGIYYKPHSLASRLCVEGNALLSSFCEQHAVPYRPVGKLIIPTSSGQEGILEQLCGNAHASGATAVSLISSSKIQEIEPHVSATLALYSPTSGIVDTASLVHCLAALAENQGVLILRQTTVTRITPIFDSLFSGFSIETKERGSCNARIVINAAGLYAPDIASMVHSENSFHLAPLRGEYCSYIPTRDTLKINGNIYPVPDKLSVGIHLTPTFDNGKILVGPYFHSIPPEDRARYDLPRQSPAFFAAAVHNFFPQLRAEDLSLDYCGTMARLAPKSDFIIERDTHYSNCIHLLGIGSPGVTASLAIAQYVKRILNNSSNC